MSNPILIQLNSINKKEDLLHHRNIDLLKPLKIRKIQRWLFSIQPIRISNVSFLCGEELLFLDVLKNQKRFRPWKKEINENHIIRKILKVRSVQTPYMQGKTLQTEDFEEFNSLIRKKCWQTQPSIIICSKGLWLGDYHS